MLDVELGTLEELVLFEELSGGSDITDSSELLDTLSGGLLSGGAELPELFVTVLAKALSKLSTL